MKKIKPAFILLIAVGMFTSSCATVFGGKVNSYQRTPPKEGQPTRPIRVVALIADIVIFAPSLIVDFVTDAIYKPTPSK